MRTFRRIPSQRRTLSAEMAFVRPGWVRRPNVTTCIGSLAPPQCFRSYSRCQRKSNSHLQLGGREVQNRFIRRPSPVASKHSSRLAILNGLKRQNCPPEMYLFWAGKTTCGWLVSCCNSPVPSLLGLGARIPPNSWTLQPMARPKKADGDWIGLATQLAGPANAVPYMERCRSFLC